MPRTATELLEEIHQLPSAEQEWLLNALQKEEFETWQREAGESEPGYEEWFRAGVEEALADTSPDTPHEQVAAEMTQLLHSHLAAKKLRASA